MGTLRRVIGFALLLLVGCTAPRQEAGVDLVLTGGRVWTGEVQVFDGRSSEVVLSREHDLSQWVDLETARAQLARPAFADVVADAAEVIG